VGAAIERSSWSKFAMQEGLTETRNSRESAYAVFSAVVESVANGRIVLRLPRSNYQLHLAAPDGATGRVLSAGERVHGVVVGESLRMYPASAGGKFIEPIWGEPRIVAGVVLEANEAQRLVIVDAVAIFKLSVPPQQDFAVLAPGAQVNFYLKSGARFELAE
jgi:hypothetical protein